MRVSDFKLVDPKGERERLLENLASFNRTECPFPADRTLHSILEERARGVASQVAVRGEDFSLTYGDLLECSGRIASWLMTLPPRSPRVVGILMENTPDMIAGIMGVLRSGAVYLPINPDLPLDRIVAMLEDTRAEILLTERKFAREANRLQYGCSQLTHLLCLDSRSFANEEESPSELSRLDLWEYVGEHSTDAISAGGWKDSYTGLPLSAEAMHEYGENTYRKLSPLLNADSRVLEIGCSSGLTMFRLAPECSLYYGIDFSEAILRKTRAEAVAFGWNHIRLQCLAADLIDQIGESDFDLIIINSVAQSFRGHNYLRKVLIKAARLLRPEGRIFVGDVMDQDRKAALVDSLLEFQRANAGGSTLTKTDWSDELFLSRTCIDDICLDLPGTATACHTEKIHSISNELTRYRFDSLITVRRDEPSSNLLRKRSRYQHSRPDLEAYSPDPASAGIAEEPAYIIYTSGTTGKPKGVVVTHRAIHNYVQWAARYYFSAGGGDMALFTSPAFDLTLTSIFVPLYLGRTIHSFRNRDIDQLLPEVFAAPVDAIKLTPSHISILEDCAHGTSIHTAIVGGEDLTVEQAEKLRRFAPGIRIYNEYGPSEATIGCSACRVEGSLIHIGKPIDNTQIWILGNDGELKPIDTAGELCVGGCGLASGYWEDDALTKQKFVPHPVLSGQRLYRTGDQARWMPDGNLMLLGRIDQQVKIRGNRIELGEIEAQLRKLPQVRDAVVAVRPDALGEKTLCAYLIAEPGFQIAARGLRASLARVVPQYLIPSYFVSVAEFPLSLNGKIDRKRLPEPEMIAQARTSGYRAPTTDTEIALAQIWSEVLGISQIGADDNFFELGGHSLKATQVTSRVHRTFQVSLELRQVFRHPTLRHMSAAIDAAREFRFTPIAHVAVAEDYELSHAQTRLWIVQQLEPESIAYNIHEGVDFAGPLDCDRLRAAFHSLVGRHEALRTIIVPTPAGPRQKILDDTGFRVVFIDLEAVPDPGWEAARIAETEAVTPFDLMRGPLLRVQVLRLGPGLHRLLLTMHHIVSDGWSAAVIVRELTALYEGHAGLPPLRIQYRDYAAWQNRLLSKAEAHVRFWHLRMTEPLPTLDLPTDYPRPLVRSFDGASLHFRFVDSLSVAIRRVAVSERVTLFMVLNAALKLMIYRLSGAEDIIVGVPVAGRAHVDLEDQVGFFANTLALRDEIRPHEGFRELLSRIRRSTSEAFEHQVYPFDRLVNELNLDRDTSRSPLFDVMLVLHNNQSSKVVIEGLRVRPLRAELPISRFDLTFHFFETANGIDATVEYSTALFTEGRIRQFWKCFERLLDAASNDLSRPIGELNILAADEFHHLTSRFHQCTEPFESPLAMFRSQVSRRADEPAVVNGKIVLTYRELDRRSSELASVLQAYARGNSIVAALLARSERNLIALLACLKAGCAYLALDPAYPIERTSTLLQDSQACAVLIDSIGSERLDGYSSPLVAFDQISGVTALPDRGEGQLAYIVYTSGSTGTPKGVAGTTKCLGNLISWQRGIIGDGLRSAQCAALGFDVSVQEMLYAVCSGGTLFVATDEERLDPARLRQFLDRHSIAVVTMPYSGLNLLFRTQSGLARLQHLRHMVTSGEQLRIMPELRQFLNQRPDVRLHNQYGPSETHVVTSYTTSMDRVETTDLPPIGKPIANTRCYILDSFRMPVPIGVAGELYIAGANLAAGYLNDDDLTARRFVTDPFHSGERMYRTGDRCRWRTDGEIEFLGRLDDQLKIRGYRIEPAEIERAILFLPRVQAACVTQWNTPEGHVELVAYYTSVVSLEETEVRDHLSRLLPPYMVPARIVRLEEFPLTATGKLDRRALPSPATFQAVKIERCEEMSELERRVARHFAAALEREDVHTDEDFFQVGGHSLRAVQLAARLQQEFAVEVPLLTVFQRPTVRRLADWLEGVRDYRERHQERSFAELNSSPGPLVFAMPPLLGYAIAFRRLAALMPEDRVIGFDFLEGPDILEEYAKSIEMLQPAGAVVLFGYSGGGNLAFELAKRLERVGRAVTLVLLDSFRLESSSQQNDEQVQRSIVLNLEYFDRHMDEDPAMRVFVRNETVRALLVKKMSSYLRHLNTIQNLGSIRGDIHIIESNEFEGDVRRAAWKNATGGLFETHQGYGSHVEMILERHVSENAAVVNRILRGRERS